MSKILVLGDIHGKLIWHDIIEKENPDLTIFLGDYVTTHKLESAEQQLSNLEDILNYKEANLDTVILLRGNHDDQHLGYHWAECSGYDPIVYKNMSSKNFKNRFLKLTQWIHIIDNNIFSHAGISKEWLRYSDIKALEDINNMEPCEKFGFTPCKMSDFYGISATQSCTWIRPQTLVEYAVDNYNQIVGHTPVHNITGIPIDNSNNKIWVCDCLDNNQYLLIDDNVFIPKTFKQ